jgi:hypothetical protein
MEPLIRAEIENHGGWWLRWERAPASEGYSLETGPAHWGWQTRWEDKRLVVFLRNFAPGQTVVAIEYYPDTDPRRKPVPATFHAFRLNELVVKLFKQAAKSQAKFPPPPRFHGNDTRPPEPPPAGPLALVALVADCIPQRISLVKGRLEPLAVQWAEDKAELAQLRARVAELEGSTR